MAVVIVYVFNRRELVTPLVVAAGLVAFAVWKSAWLSLVGLPLIYIGWRGCAPNMNLANGCLPVLASGVCFGVGATLDSISLCVAAAACGMTWIVSSLESAWRSRPEAW
jgi:hypothetical protein